MQMKNVDFWDLIPNHFASVGLEMGQGCAFSEHPVWFWFCVMITLSAALNLCLENVFRGSHS